MDQTDEEEYQYQPPEPLDIENRNGAPILLKEFVNQVHPLLNANKDEIYRCVDENFSQLTELEDGTKFDSFDPSESDGADEDEDEHQPTELSPFTRSGNIPTASKFSLTRLISTRLTWMISESTSVYTLKATRE